MRVMNYFGRRRRSMVGGGRPGGDDGGGGDDVVMMVKSPSTTTFEFDTMKLMEQKICHQDITTRSISLDTRILLGLLTSSSPRRDFWHHETDGGGAKDLSVSILCDIKKRPDSFSIYTSCTPRMGVRFLPSMYIIYNMHHDTILYSVKFVKTVKNSAIWGWQIALPLLRSEPVGWIWRFVLDLYNDNPPFICTGGFV